MSRLDRFLLSEGWVSPWDVTAQWVGNRDVSDHCLISLQGDSTNWGPKPFRFNNCWLQNSVFFDFVVSSWVGLKVDGWKAFAFKEKLKLMKEKLKVWNKEVFGNLDNKIDSLIADLNSFDKAATSRALSVDEIRTKSQISFDLKQARSMKVNLLHQKSRLRWLGEGGCKFKILPLLC